MKLITWNVNGFRAVLKKGFEDYFKSADADIFCIQETKMQPGQADFKADGYFEYYYSAERKGYSGTAIFTKKEPLSVQYGLNGKHTDEGRTITLEFDNFYFVGCYVPNAKEGLLRIDYREEFEDDLREYLSELDKKKPVIYCGDLNVAHNEIDLKYPARNVGHAGFSDQERNKFGLLLNAGFCDVFRQLYPDRKDAYTWWSYRGRARENNVGWRIDYFIASERILNKAKDVIIRSDILGSDHCPVELDIDL